MNNSKNSVILLKDRILKTAFVLMLALAMCISGFSSYFYVFAEEGSDVPAANDTGNEASAESNEEGTVDGNENEVENVAPENAEQSEPSAAEETQNSDADTPVKSAPKKKAAALKSAEQQDGATDGVAKIGDQVYPSLQAAIDNANSGDSIEVLKDIKENVKAGKGLDDPFELTIDLGGHTIRPEEQGKRVIWFAGGKSFTLKNGKVAGFVAGDSTEAVFIQAFETNVEGVEFNSNKGNALRVFYAIVMVDRHFEEHVLNISDCNFYYNGKLDGEKTLYALETDGTTINMKGCRFYGNEAPFKARSQTPDNETAVKYNLNSSRFNHNKGVVLDMGIPVRGRLTMNGVYVHDNEAEASDEAIIKLQPGQHLDREGGGAAMYYCKVYNNSGAKHTISTDRYLTVYKSSINDNTATDTGAIYSSDGSVRVETETVIKNNTATGSGDKVSGGIALDASTVVQSSGPVQEGGETTVTKASGSLSMAGGAIFDNKTPNAEFDAIDLFVREKCLTTTIKVEDFEDGDKDFSGYKWVNLITNAQEDSLGGGVAEIRKYKVDNVAATEGTYIDGVNGSDDGDGTKEKPVLTVAKAKEIADSRGDDQIIVLNRLSTAKSVGDVLDLEGKTLIRGDKFVYDPMINVSGNSNLTIRNTVLDGGNKKVVKETIQVEVANAPGTMVDREISHPVLAVSPLVNVESGSSVVLDKGAVLQNNGASTNGYAGIRLKLPNGSGLKINTGASAIMKDGAVIRNNNGHLGGGVQVDGGKFTMTGGSIEGNASIRTWEPDDFNNEAEKDVRSENNLSPDDDLSDELKDYILGIANSRAMRDLLYCYGGGVAITNDGSMLLSGGNISKNKAAYGGGGVAVGFGFFTTEDKGETSFRMTGGSIDSNTSYDTGGGINIECGTTAYISGGDIINNMATAETNHGVHAGGGIYVNGYHFEAEGSKGGIRKSSTSNIENGKLYLENVEFANNKARGEGGAIAWCGSGSGSIGEISGTSIHDNTADGKVAVTKSRNSNDILKTYNDEGIDVLFDNLATPYNQSSQTYRYVILDERTTAASISDRMLNGASYNWTDEKGNSVSKDRLANSTTLLKLKTNATASDADVQESVKMAKVHINGNSSSSNGGGLGSNGSVFIGDVPTAVEDEYEEVTEEEESKVKDVAEIEEKADKAESSVKGVSTGDSSNILAYLALMTAAALILVIAVRRRRIQ